MGVLSCLYILGVRPTLRKGIESQLFTELGSSTEEVGQDHVQAIVAESAL